MTNLDINAYGVQELNKQEMIQTEGGFIPLVIAAVVAATVLTACTVDVTINNNNGGTNNNTTNSNNPNSNGVGTGNGTNSGNGNGSNNQKN